MTHRRELGKIYKGPVAKNGKNRRHQPKETNKKYMHVSMWSLYWGKNSIFPRFCQKLILPHLHRFERGEKSADDKQNSSIHSSIHNIYI